MINFLYALKITNFKGKNKATMDTRTNIRTTISFREPPFGMITVQKGQFGYKRKTRIRLKRDKNGQVYFNLARRKYIQDPEDGRIFRWNPK